MGQGVSPPQPWGPATSSGGWGGEAISLPTPRTRIRGSPTSTTPRFIDDHTLVLLDNGNTRRASDPNADSRGQVWTLDEQTMTATLVVNADLGNYSNAFGAAERLSNGDYSFTSGRPGQAPNLFGQSIEVSPNGTKVYVLQANRQEFRSFRMRTLYEGIDDAVAG